jgi:hypothetical protein
MDRVIREREREREREEIMRSGESWYRERKE